MLQVKLQQKGFACLNVRSRVQSIGIISLEEFFQAAAVTSGSTGIATYSVATSQMCLSLQHSESLQHRAVHRVIMSGSTRT